MGLKGSGCSVGVMVGAGRYGPLVRAGLRHESVRTCLVDLWLLWAAGGSQETVVAPSDGVVGQCGG